MHDMVKKRAPETRDRLPAPHEVSFLRFGAKIAFFIKTCISQLAIINKSQEDIS